MEKHFVFREHDVYSSMVSSLGIEQSVIERIYGCLVERNVLCIPWRDREAYRRIVQDGDALPNQKTLINLEYVATILYVQYVNSFFTLYWRYFRCLGRSSLQSDGCLKQPARGGTRKKSPKKRGYKDPMHPTVQNPASRERLETLIRSTY